MPEVSLFRLYVLRATYLLIAVGLGLTIWPLLLGSPAEAEHFRGVTWCLLGTVGLLAVLGVRYPLKLIPVLLFELVWKVIWLVAIGLPLRSSGGLVSAFADTWFNTLVGVIIVPLALPWGHVIRTYVLAPADAWTRRSADAVRSTPAGR